MIGPVGNSFSAHLYRPTTRTESSAASTDGFSADAQTVDPRPGMSNSESDRRNREAMAQLTTDDWAAVSASVGYKCGPDGTGYLDPFQPQIASSLALDRDIGRLKGPLTADYLKGDLMAGQPEAYAAQLTKAIEFLETRGQKTAPSTELLLPRTNFVA